MDKTEKQKLINSIGVTAEMGLIFYRATRTAGADREEAKDLTQAYIGALMFGKGSAPGKGGDSNGN